MEMLFYLLKLKLAWVMFENKNFSLTIEVNIRWFKVISAKTNREICFAWLRLKYANDDIYFSNKNLQL